MGWKNRQCNQKTASICFRKLPLNGSVGLSLYGYTSRLFKTLAADCESCLIFKNTRSNSCIVYLLKLTSKHDTVSYITAAVEWLSFVNTLHFYQLQYTGRNIIGKHTTCNVNLDNGNICVIFLFEIINGLSRLLRKNFTHSTKLCENRKRFFKDSSTNQMFYTRLKNILQAISSNKRNISINHTVVTLLFPKFIYTWKCITSVNCDDDDWFSLLPMVDR